MDDVLRAQNSISIESAQTLSTTHNTKPQILNLTPRWLLRLLPWVEVAGGIYRVNQAAFAYHTGETLYIPRDAAGKPQITVETLRAFHLFSELTDDILNKLIKKIEYKSVLPGEAIIREGQVGNYFYIIVDGSFEVNTRERHGKTVVVNSLSEGNFFGEMALLTDIPCQANIIAKTDGFLVLLNKKVFDEAIKNEGLRDKLRQVAAERKQHLQEFTSQGYYYDPDDINIALIAGQQGEPRLPRGYVEYQHNPKEIHLNVIQSILGIHTRINDLYNVPFNQLEQQLRVVIEEICEKEESELINNPSFGLLSNISNRMSLKTRVGPPTPDDLDNLLALVWKKPSFFLAHPKAIAAFGRECTRRGVPPPTVQILGATFLTWRGIPLIPCDKLRLRYCKVSALTDILLLRVGEEDQGVVGLYNGSYGGIPGLSVQHMGINERSISNYLVTKYFSLAVLVPDAIAVLKDVELGNYYEYT